MSGATYVEDCRVALADLFAEACKYGDQARPLYGVDGYRHAEARVTALLALVALDRYPRLNGPGSPTATAVALEARELWSERLENLPESVVDDAYVIVAERLADALDGTALAG